jgi:membrane-associated protease RseP (regulator of RpoE activity)
VVVERDGESLTIPVELSRRVKVIGTIGEDLDLLQTSGGVAVGATRPDGAVAASGVAEGDVVTAVNGRPVAGLDDVAAAAAAGVGGVVVLDTAAGERRIDLGSAVEVTPPSSFFGVGQAAVVETEAPHVAVGSAVSEFGRTVGLSVAGVGQFLWPPNLLEFVTTPARSADRAEAPTTAEQTAPDSRPISIVGAVLYGSELTSENLSNLVGFLIVLNIFIGVFNLLPLLPFDGGHLVIACYEKARELRRRQQQRYIADVSRLLPLTYGVVMVLVVVGLVAVYLDLTRGVSA